MAIRLRSFAWPRTGRALDVVRVPRSCRAAPGTHRTSVGAPTVLARVVALGAVALVAHALPAQTTTVANGAAPPVLVDSSAVRAVRAATAAGRGYLFGSSAVIAMERTAPELPLVDTVTTLARLGVVMVPGADGAQDAVATLVYDSLVVRSTGLVRRPVTAPLAGESMRVRVVDGRVPVVAPADGRSACDGEAPLAGLLAELVPAVRATEPGATWDDTTTVVACRAGVPVTVTTVWRYTVRDESGPALALDRSATITIAGDVAIRDQRLVLAGTGTSAGTVTVDRTTRALRTLRATTTLQFEIGNGQQLRRFTQAVADEIRLASP
ncbi:MAG: hypothetical protein MUF21_05155 [Gemmatimonadaceae bacterium]|jgi:hypothetical protein|nr:hypothetical protein [Gemmatimonadaceae bacterium]